MTKVLNITKTCEILHKSEPLGLVYGFAIVSAMKNDKGVFDAYEDLQGDWISDEELTKAALGYAKGDRIAKAMHSDQVIGQIPFIMPGTPEVFKAFGITKYEITGLMVACKPEKQFLAKFMGSEPEWRGFSIGCTAMRTAI